MQEKSAETDIKEELSSKQEYIIELENTLDSYEQAMEEYKNEIKILETKLENKESVINDLHRSCIKADDARRLQKEIDQKSNIILQLKQQLKELPEKSYPDNEDFEELVRVTETKDMRISELEDALRESMTISTRREAVLHQEESKRKQILQKVCLKRS
mgnify:CR=1 FL=1